MGKAARRKRERSESAATAKVDGRELRRRRQVRQRRLAQLDAWTRRGRWPQIVEFVTVALSVAVVFAVAGGSTFTDVFPVAGDQVTHNWWLVEFRDRLISGDWPAGWTNDLSHGVLFGYFYFPLPPLIFSALSYLLVDAVAVKVLVVGSIAVLPVAAWRFARGAMPAAAGAVAPIVALAAVFSDQHIFVGGTFYSTLTGEFSYALGLAFGLAALGSAAALTEQANVSWFALWRTGALTALAVVSHLQAAIVPALIIGALLVRAVLQQRLLWPKAVGLVAAAFTLSAFWLVPLVALNGEALGDGHRRETLGPWLTNVPTLPVLVVGSCSLGFGLWRRYRGAGTLAALFAAGPVVLVAMPGDFLWNVRAMPWTYTAAALALCYPLGVVVEHVRPKLRVGALLVPVLVSLALPFAVPYNRGIAAGVDEALRGGKAFAATPALEDLADQLRSVPPGRAMLAVPASWYGNMPARDWITAISSYTDANVTSSITLYYEASKTTPVIEATHARVSEVAHASLSWLAYPTVDEFSDGVSAMALLGVRWYIVGDEKMYNLAVGEPDRLRLTTTASDGSTVAGEQWAVFEVIGGDTLVEAVDEPLVAAASEGDRRAAGVRDVAWLDAKIADANYPLFVEGAPGALPAPGAVQVSDVAVADERISFRVDQPGVPVLVKVSYSSLWRARGADGPYRVSGNYMVVVPTAGEVVLEIATPGSVPAGFALSGGGIAVGAALGGATLLAAVRRRRHPTAAG
jgi:hypothetical protein